MVIAEEGVAEAVAVGVIEEVEAVVEAEAETEEVKVGAEECNSRAVLGVVA